MRLVASKELRKTRIVHNKYSLCALRNVCFYKIIIGNTLASKAVNGKFQKYHGGYYFFIFPLKESTLVYSWVFLKFIFVSMRGLSRQACNDDIAFSNLMDYYYHTVLLLK